MLVCESQQTGPMNGRREQLLGLLPAFGQGATGGRRRDAHTLAADSLDHAIGFEQPVGLADGHGIDVRRLGDLSHARQEIARRQPPPGDERHDLIDNLPIDRHAAGGRDIELEGRCVHVY